MSAATFSADTRIIDLTVGELLEIVDARIKSQPLPQPEAKVEHYESGFAYGLAGFADLLGCSISTAARYKASGDFDEAIIQRGRKLIIDKRKALDVIRNN